MALEHPGRSLGHQANLLWHAEGHSAILKPFFSRMKKICCIKLHSTVYRTKATSYSQVTYFKLNQSGNHVSVSQQETFSFLQMSLISHCSQSGCAAPCNHVSLTAVKRSSIAMNGIWIFNCVATEGFTSSKPAHLRTFCLILGSGF